MSDEAPPPAAGTSLDVTVRARRRGTAHPMAGFLPVFLWGLRESFALKRLLIRLAPAVGIGLLSSLIVAQAGSRGRLDPHFMLWEILDQQLLLLVLPLIALLLVGPMFSREMRQRTLVYHLVRPVSRTTVFLARYAAGVVPGVLVALAAFWSTLFFAGLEVGSAAWTGVVLTSLFGVLVLGAVYYVLASIFKRGLIAGLVYTFVIEVLVGNLPGTIQKLSVRYHLRSLHHGLTDSAFVASSRDVAREVERTARGGEGMDLRIPFEEPTTAAVTLLIVTAALLALGCYRTATRDFALKD